MFWFLIKNSFKETIRSKSATFWALIFPFILASLYGLVFKSFDTKKMNLKPIPIMVEDSGYEMILKEIKSGEKPLFELKRYQNPSESLRKNEITGFIKGKGSDAEVVIKQGNMEATLLYNVVNSIHHVYEAVAEIAKVPSNREKLASLAEEIKKNSSVEIENGMEGRNKKRGTLYFYSLLSMICLGAMPFGVYIVESSSLQSDVKAARRKLVSPISRTKLILSDFVASLFITNVFTLLLFFYMKDALQVDFGGNYMEILVSLFLGNVLAMLLGMILATSIRARSETKTSIAAAFYVLSSTISGMMVAELSGFINHRLPIFNHINPGTVLTKLFMSLYLYEDKIMYRTYLINLIIYVSIALFVVLAIMRRRNYDRI